MTVKIKTKTIYIEAIKWNGNNLREVIDFTGLHPSANKWSWEQYQNKVNLDGLRIFNAGKSSEALVGDWIVKDVNGNFYPCRPGFFEKTYEIEGV